MFLFLSSDLAVIQEQSSSTVATSLDCEVRSNNTTTTPHHTTTSDLYSENLKLFPSTLTAATAVRMRSSDVTGRTAVRHRRGKTEDNYNLVLSDGSLLQPLGDVGETPHHQGQLVQARVLLHLHLSQSALHVVDQIEDRQVGPALLSPSKVFPSSNHV